MGQVSITPPVPLATKHDLADFDCGQDSLNHWLKKTAVKNESGHASRTFVACTKDDRVVGYYALSAGSVSRTEAPGRIKRGMPEPLPVIVLGRLAVNINRQKQGIGLGLLRDALYRCYLITESIGARAVLVHALNEDSQQFYKSIGFVESPANHLTLMMGILDVYKIFEAES